MFRRRQCVVGACHHHNVLYKSTFYLLSYFFKNSVHRQCDSDGNSQQISVSSLTRVTTSKHGGAGKVSVTTVGGLGSDSEGVDGVRCEAADLGHSERSDLDALPLGDLRRRRRVVVDAVADDVLVQRRVPGHFDRRRRDSSKLNVRWRR